MSYVTDSGSISAAGLSNARARSSIAPIVKEIADDNGAKLKVVKMNIDDSPQTPGTYGIRSIPTILVFKDGQVAGQLVGARPKGDFQEMVDSVV